MILNQDFKEFIKLLNDHDVSYLVVGGYAVAFHGYPRYTKDIDLWIQAKKQNIEKLLNALKKFGFESLDLKLEDFLEADNVIQLGYPPNRIDLLTNLAGLDFEDCYPSKVEVVIEDVKVNFIDLENLKINKKSTGRHQDLADLENLE